MKVTLQSTNALINSTNARLIKEAKNKSIDLCKRIVGCLLRDNSVWKEVHDARIYGYFIDSKDKQAFTIVMREIEENTLIGLGNYRDYLNSENTGINDIDAYVFSVVDNALNAGALSSYLHRLKYIGEQLALCHK